MKGQLRRFVRQRAHQRCKYCHLPDFAASMSLFHVEHIIALQHRGLDTPINLCWSCHRCNLKKGPNLSGVDPLTEEIAPLFHPRRQMWSRHFRWNGPHLIGLTKSGRATIAVLDMNEPQRVQLRSRLMDEGEWPSD